MKQTFKRHNLGRLIVGIGILSALFLMPVGYAQPVSAVEPPSTMNFQGRLTDDSGSIMPNGDYNMQFRIFDVASGGSAEWMETRQAGDRVTIQNGLFSVQLGEVEPLPASLFNNANLYFEITMATPATATATSGVVWESPMTPRNKLATSAYAFNAASLNGQTASDFAAATGAAGYIQNQTANPQSASFNISGTGQIGGALTIGSTSTFAGAMTVNSTATFRSDAATAFRIQNAAGANTLFSVDVANKMVVIGNPLTSSFEAFLALDRYDAPGDPAGGQDGATYYNSALSRFRCYENGSWKNCDSNTKGTPVVATDNYTAKPGDFVLADATTTPMLTITLPVPVSGATVSVKKITSSGSVTISGGGVNIDGAPNDSLVDQWHSQDYFSDGTKWYKV